MNITKQQEHASIDQSTRCTIDASLNREYTIGVKLIEASSIIDEITSSLLRPTGAATSGGTTADNYIPGKLELMRDAQITNLETVEQVINELVKLKAMLID